MAEPQYRAETILAADFGTCTTRVSLFEVVDGVYRHVASGEAPSTTEPPYAEASEGMRYALAQLQEITGRHMLDDTARLIIPVGADGSGCDVFVATVSAGAPIRTVLVGLLPDVSLKSARRVADSSYLSVVDAISLSDRRRQEQQIDAIVKAKPDLILIAGGTDGGAVTAMTQLAETVGVGCYLLPPDQRGRALFMGNSAVKERINEMLGGVLPVSTTVNVQPALGQELVDPVRAELARVVKDVRLRQIGGLADLDYYAAGHVYPTAQAEGQIIRFLSRSLKTPRGVMSVNVGSASTSIAAAFNGELFLSVASDLGVGVHAHNTLTSASMRQFTDWIPGGMSDEDFRTFVLTRSTYPHTLPVENDDLFREYALARLALRSALRRARVYWPASAPGPRGDLLPYMETIIGGGAVLARAPSAGAAAMLLLDALQPVGVTTLALDRGHFLAALGAVAYANPLAAMQVLESDALTTLGTAISVVAPGARAGDVICTARMIDGSGQETRLDVTYGSVEILPLPLGQSAKLALKPNASADIGFGAGRGKTVEPVGGVVGVIIDARGRPLMLPSDAAQRSDLVQKWTWKFTGG